MLDLVDRVNDETLQTTCKLRKVCRRAHQDAGPRLAQSRWINLLKCETGTQEAEIDFSGLSPLSHILSQLLTRGGAVITPDWTSNSRAGISVQENGHRSWMKTHRAGSFAMGISTP